MIVCDAEVEEGATIAFNLDAAFVELLGTLDVSFLELLRTLLKALHGLDFCRIGGRGVGSGRSSPSLGKTIGPSGDCDGKDSRRRTRPHGTGRRHTETRR